MYLLKLSQGLGVPLNKLEIILGRHNIIFCNIRLMKMMTTVCYIQTSFISLYTSETIQCLNIFLMVLSPELHTVLQVLSN